MYRYKERMKTGEQQSSAATNTAFWVLGLLLLGAGVIANYFYAHVALPIRLIGWIVLAAAVLAILSRTTQGLKSLAFIKESRVELRKVTWPNRQETVQTTAIVVVIVLVMGLFLWGADSVLLWAVGWLTGQRG